VVFEVEDVPVALFVRLIAARFGQGCSKQDRGLQLVFETRHAAEDNVLFVVVGCADADKYGADDNNIVIDSVKISVTKYLVL
jgi:hypothetical protein